jgi:hypothetical protein
LQHYHQCTSRQVEALQLPPVRTFGVHLRGCSAQPPDGHLYGAFQGQGGHVSSEGGQSPPYARSLALGVHVCAAMKCFLPLFDDRAHLDCED